MTKLEIPPNFHGYGIKVGQDEFAGITVAGLEDSTSQSHWDVWRWGADGKVPSQFSIGAPAIQLTTRAQLFNGNPGSISPTIASNQSGFLIEYEGLAVGAVVFGPSEADAQWWMYQTKHTGGGFLPQPSAAKPLDFTAVTTLPAGSGWKGSDY